MEKIEYSETEKVNINKVLNSYSSDSLFQKIDSMMKSQTLLYQNVPMIVNNYKAIINENGILTIINTVDGKLTASIGQPSNINYGPYTLQIEDNGNLSIINRFYEKSSNLFLGGNGNGPFTLSISNNGKLILLDSNKNVVYKSS